MFRCETCRSQTLEYLYGLLEADERQAFDAHLTECPPCQAELERARAQQKLLAAAARMEFPGVRFAVPAEAPASPSAELPLRQPARPRRWHRLALAAAVLLALGVGATAWWYDREYTRTEQAVARAEDRVRHSRDELADARAKLARLPAEKARRVEAIHDARRASQLQVKVQGPAALRAGAPTDYQVYTTDLNGQPAPARVTVEVRDRGQAVGKPVAVAAAGRGVYRVTLPPDLPVRPDSQPTLLVSARREDNGSQVDLREEMSLAAPVYVTHLEIDKPMYQLGETVHFRSLTLDRFSLRPAQEELHLQFVLTLPGGEERVVAQGRTSLQADGPNGVHEVLGPDGKPLRGVGAGSLRLDDNAPGGEYSLTVRELSRRFPEQRRKFLVNRYERPRLDKELDFSRKSYGPGDEVVARCKARYLDGRPVKDCPVRVAVRVDGRQYGPQGEPSGETFASRTDAEGTVLVRFRLPKEIERGLGGVSVTFDERAGPDTLQRPIPIVLKKLDVEFCPEGGDLVAGLRNRVYFQVRSTLGKPADLQGQLLEDGKPLGVKVQTLASEKTPELNQGMGRFEFTPRAGHKYELKVESPVGVTKLYALPEIKPEGVVLSLPRGVVSASDDIEVTVRGTAPRALLVGAYCRGRLLDSAELSAKQFADGEARAVLKPAGGAGGVCRLTVFEVLPGDGARRALRPVAERLLYRQPAERVQIALKPGQKTYVPRQTVKLGVEATTETGAPAAAVVLLRVVDKSVVTLADDKTLRAMPTHFLLTTEVRRPEDLEYADFLLGPHPRAAEALDLLLGTQGWRRFAEQDPTRFRREQREEAERLLVTIGQSQPRTADLAQEELQRAEADHVRRTEELRAKVTRAQQDEKEAREDERYHAALVRLKGFDDFTNQARQFGAPALGAVLTAAALLCLALGLFRGLARAVPYFAATAACVAAVVLLTKLAWQAAPPARHPFAAEVAQVLPKEEEKAANAAADNDRPADGAKGQVGGGGGMQARMMRGGAMFPPAPAPGAPAPAFAMPNAALVDKPGFAPPMMAGRMAEGRDKAAAVAPLRAMAQGGAGPAGFGLAKRERAEQLRKQLQPPPMLDGKRGLRLPAADRRRLMGVERELQQMEKKALAWPPMPVRVFAHARASGPAEERYDFAETLYWHPVLVLPGGKAEVSFDTCDSLGAFEVTAFAHTHDGRLGSATQTLTSRLPFTVQPRTPLEVTASDKIDVALAVANNTAEARTAHISVAEHANLSADGAAPADVSVPADSTIRKLFRFRPTVREGTATLAFTGKADGFPADTVRTTFRVVPEGFPVVGSHSDLLEKSASHDLKLPQTWVKGTLKCQVQVYPSTLADLQKGLESLLREPCGCFEQTSTSNYPNVLILQYLKESDQAKPELERRARDLLDRGYQKLTSFECLNTSRHVRQGYEWFGGTAPPHEALTAYGLMEFRDMARVRDVDPAMMQRTRQYLLGQRDGRGGFRRNPQALDTFGRAPQHITDAYIVWALTEGGKDDDVSKELAALADKAKESKDPYFLSLVANSLINRARTADAVALLKKVAGLQKDDGHLDAAETSITASGGRDLQIETTALAVLGWLKANPGEFNAAVQKAVRWVGQQRGGYGGFGSTQSTILALKALILYTRANKKTPEAGELRLFVGDKQVGMLSFPAGAAETLTLAVPDAETALHPGKNAVRVEITGKTAFPYTLSWSYQTLQPVGDDDCPVRLSAKLDRAEANEGDTARLSVRVDNASGKGQGMTVAILGLPGGLTVPEDMKQLKDYTRPPTDGGRPLLSYFELRGRELVLYWRDLAPDQKIELPIDLICRVPGEYSGPASRAYLYYNADRKHWVEPLKVRIAPKAE